MTCGPQAPQVYCFPFRVLIFVYHKVSLIKNDNALIYLSMVTTIGLFHGETWTSLHQAASTRHLYHTVYPLAGTWRKTHVNNYVYANWFVDIAIFYNGLYPQWGYVLFVFFHLGMNATWTRFFYATLPVLAVFKWLPIILIVRMHCGMQNKTNTYNLAIMPTTCVNNQTKTTVAAKRKTIIWL